MDQTQVTWSETWELVRPLGSGGQGHTFLVKTKTGGLTGVLKTLRKPSDLKARSRMAREAKTLATLATEGLKVPAVLEDYTHVYADLSVPMYFVMEFIPGEGLDQIVSQKGRLSLEESVGVVRDLGRTVYLGHDRSILHRDIKPGNVLVRDLAKADLVMVDYGLSFNEDDSPDLTETEEAVGNRFLYLPETGAGGEDKRDPRSDVTRLVGVFYYCLTGRVPRTLRDDASRAPHRTSGGELGVFLPGDPRVGQLEYLFDKGFQYRPNDRFQSCHEFLSRLELVLTSPSQEPEPTSQLAARLSEQLGSRSRKTQVERYKLQVQGVITEIHQHASRSGENTGDFTIAVQQHGYSLGIPPGLDELHGTYPIRIGARGHSGGRTILYRIGSKGSECVLLRQVFPTDGGPTVDGWQEVVWFDPDHPVTGPQLTSRITADLNQALNDVYREIT